MVTDKKFWRRDTQMDSSGQGLEAACGPSECSKKGVYGMMIGSIFVSQLLYPGVPVLGKNPSSY